MEKKQSFDSGIESYEAGEERSPLIQNKSSVYGGRNTDTDNIPDKIYAADEGFESAESAEFSESAETAEAAESADPILCCMAFPACRCEGDPDYSFKKTLKQPQFYVLYLVVSTLSLVIVQLASNNLAENSQFTLSKPDLDPPPPPPPPIRPCKTTTTDPRPQ